MKLHHTSSCGTATVRLLSSLTLASLLAVGFGCGGSDRVGEDGGPGDQGSQVDQGQGQDVGAGDAALPDGGEVADQGVDMAVCAANEAPCSAPSECCSGMCFDGECTSFAGLPLRAECSSGGQCHSGNCDPVTESCIASAEACEPLDGECLFGWECCSGRCAAGVCTVPSNGCAANTAACDVDSDCCSGTCNGTSCVGQFALARPTGSACEHPTQCMSQSCVRGICVLSDATCEAEDADCTVGADDGQCCSGACFASGCGRVPTCRAPLTECAHHYECCGELCNAETGLCEPPVPLTVVEAS